ncbi:zinc ribbon-containing protein [Brenneria sp. 4F2]|nr:zinc ribbon-containing protein [Brenneria bubanii]
MSNVARYYRDLMAAITARLDKGERDINNMVQRAQEALQQGSELTQKESEQVIQAVRRDLKEFAHSYDESRNQFTDSPFMRVIKESIWQELVDITDKTQLEWRELFKDVSHHGVYHSGDVVGLGNLVCEKCHYRFAIYTPEILPLCPKCSHDLFQRQPFQP